MSNEITQPTLPPEGDYTDLERLFISEQPQRLWPVNQNSNFGALRKVLTDPLQGAVDDLREMSLERHPQSASGYLGRWEYDLGLPVAPTGKTEVQRRAAILVRLAKGVFTKRRRREIIEAYVQIASGASTALTPDGVPLDAGGVTLYGEFVAAAESYRIYEDVRNFSYEVAIKDTIDPDLVGLQRELRKITPAHINFTITEYANVLDYYKLIRDLQPNGYYRLGFNGATDYSGYGHTATPSGVVEVAGLLDPAVYHAEAGNPHNAQSFDGVNDYIDIPASAQTWLTNDYTISARVRPDALPGAGNYFTFLGGGGGYGQLGITGASGTWSLVTYIDGVQRFLQPTVPTSIGVAYSIVARRRGDESSLFVNGVKIASVIYPGTDVFSNGTVMTIGGYLSGAGNFWRGVVDEEAHFNYALSDAKILEIHRTALNLA